MTQRYALCSHSQFSIGYNQLIADLVMSEKWDGVWCFIDGMYIAPLHCIQFDEFPGVLVNCVLLDNSVLICEWIPRCKLVHRLLCCEL